MNFRRFELSAFGSVPDEVARRHQVDGKEHPPPRAQPCPHAAERTVSVRAMHMRNHTDRIHAVVEFFGVNSETVQFQAQILESRSP